MVARLLDVHDEVVDDGAKSGGSLNRAAIGNKTHWLLSYVAFSSEVDTGSREENASNKNLELRF
jgi:hypothetical protein